MMKRLGPRLLKEASEAGMKRAFAINPNDWATLAAVLIAVMLELEIQVLYFESVNAEKH